MKIQLLKISQVAYSAARHEGRAAMSGSMAHTSFGCHCHSLNPQPEGCERGRCVQKYYRPNKPCKHKPCSYSGITPIWSLSLFWEAFIVLRNAFKVIQFLKEHDKIPSHELSAMESTKSPLSKALRTPARYLGSFYLQSKILSGEQLHPSEANRWKSIYSHIQNWYVCWEGSILMESY